MKIIVDTHLAIYGAEIRTNPHVKGLFREALTIPNTAREDARREHVYGWQHMPETIELFHYDASRDVWLLPRGYAAEFFDDLETMGIEFEIEDARRADPMTEHMKLGIGLTPNRLRPYQRDIVDKMLKVEQGVLEAPPGSGKTVASLELIRQAGRKSLVIVDKANIAKQWMERSREFLGYIPGLIGDGEFKEQDFSIALVQTLWSRQDELIADGFFDRWGLVLLDECHHAPARTFSDTMQRFPAYYRFGVSATPERREGQWALVEAAIGPLLHRITKGDLRSLGVLVSPKVTVHQTAFSEQYFPTHKKVNDQVCDRMGCTRARHTRLHRNNYTDIVGRLAEDRGRNRQIASNILKDYEDGRACLVLSARKTQLKLIRDQLLELNGNIGSNFFMFTGDEDSDRRQEIVERADKGMCVIFSTIGDEALDIPRLDSLHLVWPTRNTQKVRQQLGRVERIHSKKQDAVVHDYADDVGPLRGQLADRFSKVYVKEGLQLEVPEWLRRS